MSFLSQYREALFHVGPQFGFHEHLDAANTRHPNATNPPPTGGGGGSSADADLEAVDRTASDSDDLERRVLTPQEAEEIRLANGGIVDSLGQIQYRDSASNQTVVLAPLFDGNGQIAGYQAVSFQNQDRLNEGTGTGGGGAARSDTTLAEINSALQAGDIRAAWPTGLGRWTIQDSQGRFIDLEPNSDGSGLNWFAPKTSGTVPPGAYLAGQSFLDEGGAIIPPSTAGVSVDPFTSGAVQPGLGGLSSDPFFTPQISFRGFTPGVGERQDLANRLNLEFGSGEDITTGSVLTNALADQNPLALRPGTQATQLPDTQRARQIGSIAQGLGPTFTQQLAEDGFTPEEEFAALALQGQQSAFSNVNSPFFDPFGAGRNIRSVDQQVIQASGLNPTFDPIQDAALAQQLTAARQQIMLGDPTLAAGTAATLAGQGLRPIGFADGGSMRVQRRALLIDAATGAPLAEIAEGGRQEDIHVVPTNLPALRIGVAG